MFRQVADTVLVRVHLSGQRWQPGMIEEHLSSHSYRVYLDKGEFGAGTWMMCCRTALAPSQPHQMPHSLRLQPKAIQILFSYPN